MADELVPLPTTLSAEQISDLSSDLSELGISKDMEALLQRGLTAARLPKALRTQKAAEAMQTAFDIIGGVPRLALWADKNPDKFYPLFARMIPQTVAPVVTAMPAQSKEDQRKDWPEWLTARRLAYQESQEVAADIMIKDESDDRG